MTVELPKRRRRIPGQGLLPGMGEHFIYCRGCGRRIGSAIARKRGYGRRCWVKAKEESAPAVDAIVLQEDG